MPLSVERVMRQVALEREVAAAISVREKQELLEAAFDAARLASCVWDVKRNEIKWSGHTEQLFGFQVEEQCRDYDSFINLIFEEDRASARECISESSRTKAQFDCQFRIARPNSEIRWISAKGRFYFDKDGNAVRMIIVLNDFTQRKHHELELLRSHQQIKALNDRLQLSIVETHHRTKNSLQNVISLLHLHLRQHGSLNEEEVKKLTAHIQGLAVIHDVLVDQAKEEGNTGSIALDQVIERMLCVLDRASGSRSLERILTPCHVTSRQGASLSVIVNELVSNALKHGNGKVLVQMDVQGEQGTLDVINEGSTFPTGFNLETTNRTGLLLIQTLARADLRSEPNFENLPDGRARVRISFPTTVVKKVEVKPVETLH